MKRLAIVGGGDHGVQIAYVAEATGKYKIQCFFDDFKTGKVFGEAGIAGKITDIKQAFKNGLFDEVILGIGYKHMTFKKSLYYDLTAAGIPFATLVHPSAIIHPTCKLYPGAVIYQGVILDINVTIGPHAIIHCGCIIAHDSKVEGHSFLSPGVNIAGYTTVGSLVHIGIGVTIIDRLEICSDVSIGAGSVIVEHITKPGLYFGVPAKWRK
jgi:sugar O-acyltransferase (sialic acid O-acetyltransferase NeuD family)